MHLSSDALFRTITVAHERWVAATLQIRENLATLRWDAPRPIDASKVGAVRAALVADQGKMPVATDPYFFGKQVCASLWKRKQTPITVWKCV